MTVLLYVHYNVLQITPHSQQRYVQHKTQILLVQQYTTGLQHLTPHSQQRYVQHKTHMLIVQQYTTGLSTLHTPPPHSTTSQSASLFTHHTAPHCTPCTSQYSTPPLSLLTPHTTPSHIHHTLFHDNYKILATYSTYVLYMFPLSIKS